MATIRVNGEDLDLPERATLTLDDSLVIYHYSKLTIDQFEEVEGLHQGALAALIHIAVQRANPDMKAAEIERSVRGLSLNDVVSQFVVSASEEEKEEEAGTPDLAPLPDKNSDGNGSSSGSGSEMSSETSQDESPPSHSGTPTLASVESLPTMSVG